MDRNWLIRTSQNQILGPVAKAKLLEFIQKGALGMTDEVASGNGYWFSLKEKELVEKYLYGDIPQGYNPISESKSVLSKRENPEKTTSINTAPANKTQILSRADLAAGLAPKNEDLEYPDITVIRPAAAPAGSVPVLNFDDDNGLKLPNQDDLEFPDVNAIKENVGASFKYPTPSAPVTSPAPVHHTPAPVQAKAEPVKPKMEMSDSGEAIALPSEDDLAFPDMGDFQTGAQEDKTTTKVEKGKVDLEHQYTRTVALDEKQAAEVLPESKEIKSSGAKPQRNLDNDFGDVALSLDLKATPAPKEEPAVAPVQKRERPQVQHNEDKKLLHERRPKANSKAAQRDPSRETVHREPPEPLKKRNDNYIFFILIIIILIIVAVFFYFKEILNKPLPV